MIKSIVMVSSGACVGATLRWLLGVGLNSLFPHVAFGTLVANMVGGYLIGIAMSFFALFPALDPAWRLLIITGFLGALTTFSAFSAEVVALLQQQRLLWAMVVVTLHVIGSLCMTFLGIASVSAVKHWIA